MVGDTTPQFVFVSRLGTVLQERGIGVGELQRRLERRGYRISRGALDRLVSSRPVRAVQLDILVPVLEELRVDLDQAFEQVEASQAAEEASTRAAAAAAVRALPPRQTHTARASAGGTSAQRQSSVGAANRDLDEVGDELLATLRKRHPELFDRRGRLRRRVLTRLLAERAGKRRLTKADVLALTQPA